MRGTTVARVSISLPSDLLREFDRFISEIHQDRSKAIQAAMRLFLSEQKDLRRRKGSLLGAIAVTYDHEASGLEEKLTDIQHAFTSTVRGAMHIHLDERNCLQVIAVKGSAQRVRGLVQELMSEKGVKQLKPAIVRTWKRVCMNHRVQNGTEGEFRRVLGRTIVGVAVRF